MSEGVFVRPTDLTVVGVSWTGMQVVPGTGVSGPPELEAVALDATLALTLPPQHIGEETVGWGWWGPTWRSLAGEAPPGAPMAAMSTHGRLDVFFAADDGIVYANRREAGAIAWQTDLGAPLTATSGATFVPGSPLVAVGLDTVTVFGVDDAGRLCSLVVDAAGGFGAWFPVDSGTGEASGFDPGANVEVSFVNDETNVFLVRGGRLIHWSASGGVRDVRQVSTGAHLTATAMGGTLAVVFWITDDGEVIGERWDGTSWITDNFATPVPPAGEAPSPQLRPWTVLHAQTTDNRVIIFFVTADGAMWAMSTSLSSGLDGPFWAQLSWARLAQNFPSVTPIVSQLVVNVAAAGSTVSFKRPVLGIGVDGKAWATWSPNTGPTVTIEGWQAIGDWFPPGGHICVIPHGERDLEAFAVASDRTVRHAELSGGRWQTVPPDWEATADIRPRRAALAGPSRVVVQLLAGDRVTLTTEGVLAMMASRTLDPASVTSTDPTGGTVLEMPWGLFVSPAATPSPHLRHAIEPVVSVRDGVGVWHTHLRTIRERDAGTEVEMRALRSRPDADGGPGFVPALDELQRRDIRDASQLAPFRARRTTLSALGASFDIEGHWPALDWEHVAAGGRDLYVRTVQRGVLYPFGHEATYEELTIRRFDPRSATSVAVLHRQGTVHVSEPLHVHAETDSAQFRSFPFTEVEVGVTAIRDLDRPRRQLVMPDASGGTFFLIERDGRPVRVPVHLRRDGDEVTADAAMLFVQSQAFSDVVDPPTVDATLRGAYAAFARMPVTGAPVRLAGDQRFDTHELQLVSAAPGARSAFDLPVGGGPLAPQIVGATVGLPAVQQLTRQAHHYAVTFNEAYRVAGDTKVLLDAVAGEIGVSFAGRADLAGGIAAPSFAADAISGAGEPIRRALAGAQTFDPEQLFDPNAKLLGLVPLRSVIDAAASGKPPSLSSLSSLVPTDPSVPVLPSVPPVVRLSWEEARCKAVEPFFKPIDGRTSTLSLSVTASVDASTGVPTPDPHVTTDGKLTNFCLSLADVLEIRFDEVAFHVETGRKPSLKFRNLDFSFAGDLHFLDVLQDAAEHLVGELPVAISATPTGITASHHLAIPPLSLNVGTVSVSLTDLVFSTQVVLPFDAPVEVELGFASRQHPFLLGVWILGGGGYLRLRIVGGEVTEFACAAELGGLWSFDWVVVAGEVHALLGFDMRLTAAGVVMTGYLRVGGTVEVFGLVSVGIELSASITVEEADPINVYVDARIVLEVDLFLASTSVSLHKRVQIYGEGGILDDPVRALRSSRRAISVADARAAWIRYRSAFEEQVA